jgi:hypothetical protein
MGRSVLSYPQELITPPSLRTRCNQGISTPLTESALSASPPSKRPRLN